MPHSIRNILTGPAPKTRNAIFMFACAEYVLIHFLVYGQCNAYAYALKLNQDKTVAFCLFSAFSIMFLIYNHKIKTHTKMKYLF